MSKKRRDRAISSAAEQRADEPPVNEPDWPSRPLVRRELILCVLGLLALTAGYYGGQVARGMVNNRAASTVPSSTDELTVVPATTPSSAPLLTFDPDAPLPATADAVMQETVSVIDDLLKGFPDTVDMLEMKARTQVWLGNSSEALETWQACLKLDPKYIHAYVGMASAAAARAEHEKAAELAQQAIELDPLSFQAREIRADALLQLGRPEEVPAVFEKFLAADPRSRGFYLLGQAYSQLKQFDKAQQQYEAAVRLYPDYTEAYNGLAIAYDRLGEKEKAEQAREKFRQLGSPENAALRIRGAKVSDLVLMYRDAAVLYTDAGRVCYVSKKEADAELLWLRAAALDPQNKDSRQSLAWLYRNTLRLGETISWLKQLADLEPDKPSYWVEIGRIYEELLNLPAAEKAFRKACEVAPQNDVGYAAVADLLLRYKQNLAETKQLAGKAVELRPSAANYAILSGACRCNDDLPGARTAIEEALKLAPRNATYRAIRDGLVADQQN